MKKNIKMLVVTCHDISAIALDELKKKIEVPVIGIIEPGVKAALEETKNKRIGIIGTDAVISSKAYSSQLKKLDKKIKVFEKACPLFELLAEERLLNSKAVNLIAKEYLDEFKELDIDTLILGCSYYPVLADVISKVAGKKVKLINAGKPAAYVLQNYLEGRGIRSQSVQIGSYEFYLSDITVKTKNSAERFYGRKLDNLNKVDYLNTSDVKRQII